jgi:hypothetical protein
VVRVLGAVDLQDRAEPAVSSADAPSRLVRGWGFGLPYLVGHVGEWDELVGAAQREDEVFECFPLADGAEVEAELF